MTEQLKTFTLEAMTMPFTVRFAVTVDQATTTNFERPVQQISTFLQQIDRDFSPFKSQSLVSRYQRNELAGAELTDQFLEIYGLAVQAQELTAGAFTPFSRGQYDPTGLVKGWAIQRAFEAYLLPLIHHEQVNAVALNGAGDMQLAVAPTSDFVWHVGIESPIHPQTLVHQYALQNGAVATSGISKRGQHITTVTDDHSISQATIIATTLIEADVLATAMVAMGQAQFEQFRHRYETHGLFVTTDQGIHPF